MPQYPLATSSAGPPLLLLLLPLLALCAFSALALPVSETTERVSAQGPATDSQERCEFDGTSDLYGLGIRLGLYFQWAAFCIAHWCIRSESKSVEGINNCFLLAMFAGLIFLTVTKQRAAFYTVESLIMLIFSFGGMLCGNPPLMLRAAIELVLVVFNWFRKTMHELFRTRLWWVPAAIVCAAIRGVKDAIVYVFHVIRGDWGRFMDLRPAASGAVHQVLSVGFCAYGVWFAFVGMDDMLPSPCSRFWGGGGPIRMDLSGWFRISIGVTALIGVLLYVPSVIVEVLFWVACAPCRRCLCRKRQEKEGGENEDKDLPAHPYISCGRAILLAAVAFSVEMTIWRNHIRRVNHVNSVGQLVPLVVGAVGFRRVASKAIFGSKK